MQKVPGIDFSHCHLKNSYFRYNMKLDEFYRECEIRLKPEVARSVPKALLGANKCLRGLVSRLPYLQVSLLLL